MLATPRSLPVTVRREPSPRVRRPSDASFSQDRLTFPGWGPKL